MTAQVKASCPGTNRFGEPCKGIVQKGSEWCFYHDPDKGEEQAAAKAAAGQPEVFDAKQRALFVELIGRGETVGFACETIGVVVYTYRQARKRHPEFAAEVDEVIASRVVLVGDALYQGAIAGNPTQQIFFLCNRDPDNWKHVQTIHAKVANEPGEAFRVEHALAHEAEPMTDEQWAERIASRAVAASDRERMVRAAADAERPAGDGQIEDAGAADAEAAD